MSRPRVCIVTPGYISATPRVFREADALSAAGFDVRVVFSQGALTHLRRFDADLLGAAAWRSAVVRWSRESRSERRLHYWSAARQRLLRALEPLASAMPGVVEGSESRVFRELAALATAEPADLYIGHYPIGLAAAAKAARLHRARLGYDIEDLYAEIRPRGPAWDAERSRVIKIERRYVSRCVHLTSASRPVATEFARRYGTKEPTAIHNCHPWSQRDRMDGRTVDRVGRRLSLYWYSQTIGLDRGLQEVIAAAGLLGGAVQVHLRGTVDGHVRETLARLARDHRIEDSFHFHEPVTPDLLLSRAAEHDVGLAVERADSLNRQLSVTNKLFLFLTAGLAIAATDLAGQRDVLGTEVGRLVPVGAGHQALASYVQALSDDSERLAREKRASLAAAQARWNWEREGERLVEQVRAALAAPLRAA